MDEVERFVTELQMVFASGAGRDELKAPAHRKFAVFIGAVVARGDQYAPPEEITSQLAEARRKLQGLTFEGEAKFIRLELLTELDRAIASIAPNRLPKLNL